MTSERVNRPEVDPGAYIGNEPERDAETIPGGVKPGDERIAAYGAAPGVPEESDSESDSESAAEPQSDDDSADGVKARLEPTLE